MINGCNIYLRTFIRSPFQTQEGTGTCRLKQWKRRVRCELFPCSYSVSSLNFCCWISRPCQPQISQRALGGTVVRRQASMMCRS
ncbi:hypothetical protein XENTR_v10019189 [Xenopus tropicalis]|nr:hypothetical protein XENTR_v10019189 [Xenopus tropicalis]